MSLNHMVECRSLIRRLSTDWFSFEEDVHAVLVPVILRLHDARGDQDRCFPNYPCDTARSRCRIRRRRCTRGTPRTGSPGGAPAAGIAPFREPALAPGSARRWPLRVSSGQRTGLRTAETVGGGRRGAGGWQNPDELLRLAFHGHRRSVVGPSVTGPIGGQVPHSTSRRKLPGQT